MHPRISLGLSCCRSPRDQRARPSACASKRSAISLRTRWRRLRPGTRGGIEGAAGAGDGRAVSAWPPSAHWPTTAPVAGLTDSETVPDAVRLPSIQSWRSHSCAGFFGRHIGSQPLDASSISPHGLTRDVAASPLRSAELDSVLGQTPPRPRELRRLNLTLQVIVSTFT